MARAKRVDNKGRVLRVGESQNKDGRYCYKWTDSNGKRSAVYALTLAELRKKEEQMRKNLQVGDDITTIGGIMGKVISIKEETDSLVIETGVDRSKVRVKRWAVASCDTIHDDVE